MFSLVKTGLFCLILSLMIFGRLANIWRLLLRTFGCFCLIIGFSPALSAASLQVDYGISETSPGKNILNDIQVTFPSFISASSIKFSDSLVGLRSHFPHEERSIIQIADSSYPSRHSRQHSKNRSRQSSHKHPGLKQRKYRHERAERHSKRRSRGRRGHGGLHWGHCATYWKWKHHKGYGSSHKKQHHAQEYQRRFYHCWIPKPTLKVSAPRPRRIRVNEPEIEVQGRFSGDITKVFVAGKEAEIQIERGRGRRGYGYGHRGKRGTFKATVSLKPGWNVIRVVGIGRRGHRVHRIRFVHYKAQVPEHNLVANAGFDQTRAVNDNVMLDGVGFL